MCMLHKLFISFATVLILSAVSVGAENRNAKLIAITQIVDHQSLNNVYNGIIAELKDRGYCQQGAAKVVFENAHGNMGTAVQIAQKFVGMNADVIIAIATPSAQAAIKTASYKHIPVVFASVTDPVGSQLVRDLQTPGGLVTGVRQPPPLNEQIELVRNLVPKVKNLGVILNYGEDNSVQQLKMLEKYAATKGINIVVTSASSSAGVSQAAASLVGRADAFFLLQDNTVASAIASVLKVAHSNGIPVFAGHSEAVAEGALASLAYNEYDIGRQTGAIAIKILEGTLPSEIPVENPRKLELVINKKVASNLGITVSKELIARADQVFN